MLFINYLVVTHEPPVVVPNLTAVRSIIRDDYYQAFDGSDDETTRGLAEWTNNLTWRGGTFTFPDGSTITVSRTFHRAVRPTNESES